VTIVQPLYLVGQNASNQLEAVSRFLLINLRLRQAFNLVCFLVSLTVAARTVANVQREVFAAYCGEKYHGSNLM
jgi:hypothetical protein